MMQDSKILTAIDVGTTKVCTIIAKKLDSGRFEVLGHSLVPCNGLSKGNVDDVIATQRAVSQSLQEAQQKAGIKVTSAHVGVTGSHVSFENRFDTMDWVGKHGVITEDDLSRVPETVATASKTFGRKVIHAIPVSYTLDGSPGIKNPMGMHTRHMEVETHLVSGSTTLLDRLIGAVEHSGVKVESLVLEPLASSEAVLTLEERIKGAAVIDIGGGTTDVMVFQGGSIAYSAVIPVGGFQFTNDICLTYNTPYEDAEEAKLNFAHTEPDTVGSLEEITLPVAGRSIGLKVPRRDLCQLMRERAMELMRLIMLKLKEADKLDVADFQLVLTGGASNLAGLEQMIKRTLTSNVRIGVPEAHTGIPKELQSPQFSTGVGILIWARSQQPTAEAYYKVNGNGNGHSKAEHLEMKEPVAVGDGRTSGPSRFFKAFRRS